MAKKPEIKENKILTILKTEYKFERVLLGVLGVLVLVLGIYLVEGDVLEIRFTELWIFNTDTKILIFSIIVIVVGAVALLMAIWSFFVPSLVEMKKVTWPSRSTILNHSARVFGFILILSLFFVLIDFGLRPLFLWIAELGA